MDIVKKQKLKRKVKAEAVLWKQLILRNGFTNMALNLMRTTHK